VAATFRTIETVRPTLLIDEADTFLGENEELRGILNSGHRKGGHVVRTVGDDFEPRIFSTHCPVAIAQIGKLPDTLADRSVHISMKRRAPGEAVSRFRGGRTPELAEAARKAARWVADNAEAIRECEPMIPDAIYNRAADNWEPLLAVAEVAGADVAARGRQAALAARGIEEELSQGAALLADIRGVFEDKDTERMTSADLVTALVAMADRPWGECNRGKPLTQNGLARKLKDFKIRPEMIGPKERRVSGYTLKSFEDSFGRYILAFQPHTLTPHNKINGLDKNQTSHQKNGCEVENSSNALNLNELCGCEASNSESGIRAQNGDNVTGEDTEIEL
jgi:putative DNA primase/helicase